MGFLRKIILKHKTLRNKYQKFIVREYEQKFDLIGHQRNARYDILEANEIVRELLKNGRPALFGRMGETEARIIYYYMQNRGKPLHKTAYPLELLEQGAVQPGVYPASESVCDYFCKQYIAAVRNSDLLCVWNVKNEHEIITELNPSALTVPFYTLTPYDLFSPWTTELAGKRVLFVSPFVEIMEQQYAKRELLFENKRFLPEFKLLTYKAIQAYGGNPDYASYIEVLEKMKADIAEIDFDIALIGAGGYALPLGSAIKEMGKIAITPCGATQLFFAITGSRWINDHSLDHIVNEYWVTVPDSLKPTLDAKSKEIVDKLEGVGFPY